MARPKNVSTVFYIRHQDKMILRVLKISEKGFMVNQHLKSVTKPKFNLSQATTRRFFRKCILYLNIAWSFIFKMAPWEAL